MSFLNFSFNTSAGSESTGMRPAEGKKNCLVLDFAKNIERHGPINQIKPNQKGKRKKTGQALVKSCLAFKSYVP